MKACGQTGTVTLQVSDQTLATGGVSYKVSDPFPFTGYIKRVEMHLKNAPPASGTCFWGAALSKGPYQTWSASVQSALASGSLEWLRYAPGTNVGMGLGGGVIFARSHCNTTSQTHEWAHNYECWKKIYAGEVLVLAMANAGATMTDGDAAVIVHYEPACKKHPPDNWKSSYPVSWNYDHGASSFVEQWVAPADGWLRNVEVFAYQDEADAEMEFYMGKWTGSVGEQQHSPHLCVLAGEGYNVTFRNWHPGWYLKKGQPLHIQGNCGGYYRWFADWLPDHGAPMRMQFPLEGIDASNEKYLEMPLTVALTEATIEWVISASAARQGHIIVAGPVKPHQYDVAVADLEDMNSGLGSYIGSEMDASGEYGAQAHSLFTTPVDQANATVVRYPAAVATPGIVAHEGDYFVFVSDISSLSSDITGVFTIGGHVLNRGRRARTRCATGATELATGYIDLAMEV